MLTQEVQDVLAIALVDRALAAEFAVLADAAGAATDGLKRNLEIALADKDAFDEILAVLEGGAATLSENAKDVLAIALCDKDAVDAVVADLEA